MTAAIPPACCADADHAKPHREIDRIGRADRGGLVLAGAGHVSIRSHLHQLRNESLAVTLTFSDILALPDKLCVRRRVRRRHAMPHGLDLTNADAHTHAYTHC